MGSNKGDNAPGGGDNDDGGKHHPVKKDTPEYVGQSYGLAYEYGNKKIKEGKMMGFNVGMNIGLCAGQTILWPHIHFIPRHEGDAEHHGGMRYSHPSADHNHYY